MGKLSPKKEWNSLEKKINPTKVSCQMLYKSAAHTSFYLSCVNRNTINVSWCVVYAWVMTYKLSKHRTTASPCLLFFRARCKICVLLALESWNPFLHQHLAFYNQQNLILQSRKNTIILSHNLRKCQKWEKFGTQSSKLHPPLIFVIPPGNHWSFPHFFILVLNCLFKSLKNRNVYQLQSTGLAWEPKTNQDKDQRGFGLFCLKQHLGKLVF